MSFLTIWTHILATKGPNKEFLKQNFKVKFLKIISFWPFLTQIGQNFGPKHPSNVAFLAIFTLNFHFCTTTTFCFERYSQCKIWKKTYWQCLFLYFFHNIGPNLAQIGSRPYPLWFFWWFPMKYVRGFN